MSKTHLTTEKFAQMGLEPEVLAGLESKGFHYCTPIQALSLPLLVEGHDLAGQAQTGTGKTLAFLAATFNYLLTLETRDGIISVWLNRSLDACHISDYRPKNDTVWTTEPELMDENKILIPYSHKTLGMIRTMFSRGMVNFSSPQARNAFIQIWKRR